MEYQPLDLITVDEISAVGVPSDDAKRLCSELAAIVAEHGSSGPETWTSISRRLLNPDQPFAFHQMMYYGCYKGYLSDTPPAWIPDRETAVLTNIGKLLENRGKELLGLRYKDPISSFSDFQEFSTLNPEAYWKMVLDEMRISFFVQPSCILQENPSFPGGQWFPGAVLNSAWNCLNLNDKKSLEDVAVIWRDEGYDSLPVHRMTLNELRAEVCLVANAIETLGLSKGSAIAIDMPMTVNAVIIYLAIVLAGFVVVSIADSFAPLEISTRLTISSAKAIFTQDFIPRGDKKLPLYSRVIDSNAPLAIVIPASGSTFSCELRTGDISWLDFLGRVTCSKPNEYDAEKQPVDAFTNILFSSGTTGEPKAIPWTHATPIKAAADAWCHMDVQKGDVVAWPTNLGWMMGPWLVYATLLNGASMALYNGSPLGPGFAKFVQDAKVTMLGVVPSIVRAWKNANCTAGFDWSNIRCFSSSGEASSVNEYLWLMGRAHYKPVIEYCGGTEIGGGFVTGSFLQPQAVSSFSTPAMGCNLLILDSDGNPLPRNTPGIGELALDPTLFGSSTTLLNADHYDVYFKGMPTWNGKVLRRHGDEFEYTAGGYYKAHGRADDTMNLGGIKISSIEIERVCNGVNDSILETAAFGLPPSGGGPEQLVIAVVFKDQTLSSQMNMDQLKQAFNSALQKKLNPLFKVSSVMAVPSLPRTASNKVMRRVLRQQSSQLGKLSKF
ncbi:Acetate--CoA ligase protein [Dioscorea alata]|uniref:Acetate--CoA ligase protein n=1 Tax=Dioscorea alata TaxID=55571 RepID=A0ACB7WLS8_DIOAL|nr:Acetate--CoA ligase protein [Dioscorea alata]